MGPSCSLGATDSYIAINGSRWVGGPHTEPAEARRQRTPLGLVVFLLRGDIEAKSCVEDLVAVSDFNEFAGSNAGSNAVPDPKEGF